MTVRPYRVRPEDRSMGVRERTFATWEAAMDGARWMLAEYHTPVIVSGAAFGEAFRFEMLYPQAVTS